jgi:hypothetical protein
VKRNRDAAFRVFLLCAGLAFPQIAQAQHESKNQSNIFGAVGGFTRGGGVSAGGGIGYERLLYKGLAGGIDFEGFGSATHGGVLATTNGSFHFRNATASKRLAPFGTAGFSSMGLCAGECRTTGGVNFGGGFNYWSDRSKGFRVEFRDHIFTGDWELQMWELRVGLSF